MTDPKAPPGPGWWWRLDCDGPVRVTIAPPGITPALWWQRPDARGPSHVTNDGHWLAPVLTPTEASALTERAERERDEARRWAEAAAADENANAAELREVRATLDAVAALVGPGDVVERVRQIIAERDELASAFREHVEAVDNARYCYHDSTLWSDDGLDDRIDAAEQRLSAIERAHRVNP